MLQLPPSEVHVWYWEPGALTAAAVARQRALLSSAELGRYERFLMEAPAHQFMSGRTLLRAVLAEYLGIPAQLVDFQLGEHGKPALAGPGASLNFSLAHANGLIGCALLRGGDVGFDLEDHSRSIELLPLAKRFFSRSEYAALLACSPSERAGLFFQLWTLKEACLKAVGSGLTQPLSSHSFDLSEPSAPRLQSSADGVDFQLAQFELPPRHLAALAIRSGSVGERRVVVRRWSEPAAAP